ncbi:MAG: ABC transporter permease [Lachnospiraceae bacterium]|nr:ABC transporter permease [Lachnospiraceae bacterium]
MIIKLIRNDIKQNKLAAAATVFFMAASAMLLSLTAMLAFNLLGAIDGLMEQAKVPDYMQMHAGEINVSELSDFVKAHREISEWQLCRFLNLDNSRITLGDRSLADSTQDNGLCVQGERFDYLLDMENKRPEVFPGEVYVPVCYRNQYHLSVGDTMEIGNSRLRIAGFLRDAQMNSMMASSKRFLVHPVDYEAIKSGEKSQEEYLIEFLMQSGADTGLLDAAYAAAGLPANGPAITRPLVRMMNALSDGTMIFVMFLLSIIILLISMLCLRFLLLLQMERDQKEVGMLKALGVGKREIRQLYFAKYVLFSGCGALIGLLASFLLKVPLARQLQELYGVMDGGFGTAAMAILAVLFVEGILLFTIRCALKKTEKLSVLEVLSFAAQEKQAEKGQSVLTGMVAVACTLLILIPQNLYATMSDPAFVTYMGIGNSDIRMDVRQNEKIDAVTEQMAEALRQDRQVKRYAVLQTRTCPALLADGKTVNLIVETGDHSIFPVSCSEGRLPKRPAEIALSVMNAKELGVTVGDSLELIVDGIEVAYTVCGIYPDITNGGKTAKAYSVGEDMPVQWSVLYVSLEGGMVEESWMEQYRRMGADVTDLADYVRDTYGQTLGQLRLAAGVATGIAVMVMIVVVMLFMRLLVEKNRRIISLHKAIGFTGRDLKRIWLIKGLVPVTAGICAGLAGGNLFGEELCGMALRSFGADGFRFVVDWEQILVRIPVILLGPALMAILAGIAEIGQIGACECCMGKE